MLNPAKEILWTYFEYINQIENILEIQTTPNVEILPNSIYTKIITLSIIKKMQKGKLTYNDKIQELQYFCYNTLTSYGIKVPALCEKENDVGFIKTLLTFYDFLGQDEAFQ